MPPALARSLFQCGYKLINDGVSLIAHLIIGRILNRMRNEDAIEFRQSQRRGLLLGRIAERARSHYHCRLAVDFKPY